jgi:hypothetical protein
MHCQDIGWMYVEIGRNVGRETGDSFAMSEVVYLLLVSSPVYLLRLCSNLVYSVL